jgi:transposase InsO family protein
MGRNEDAWAVFRCSLLTPLLLGEIDPADRESYFRELAAEERLLPNGRRERVSVRTLRRWWQRLRDEGVPGTFRRRRQDRGQPRANQRLLLERAVQLKQEQPRRSALVINRILLHELGRSLPRSTLYRHLRRAGATRRKLGVSTQTIRCRWTRHEPGALWVGDFEHGPPVIHEGQARKTYLSAWIDCHSRYVVEAHYYLAENFDILVDSLLRAWGQHGASRELYVDNAKIYHATALRLACTQLEIKLLHRPPLDPPAGGLIERFFQTLQQQFEAEVRAARPLSLADLNLALRAWRDEEYHLAVHSQTKETPAARHEAVPRLYRPVRAQRPATVSPA